MDCSSAPKVTLCAEFPAKHTTVIQLSPNTVCLHANVHLEFKIQMDVETPNGILTSVINGLDIFFLSIQHQEFALLISSSD